jgi:dipeptidyl aminopeptidase/acylaminoacyl peptidase
VYDVPAGDNGSEPTFAPDGKVVAVTITGPPAPLPAAFDRVLEFIGLPRDRTTWRTETRVIDIASGRILANLDRIERVRFSPDGATLAVVEQDGLVYLYDWPLTAPWARIIAAVALAVLETWTAQAIAATWRRRART